LLDEDLKHQSPSIAAENLDLSTDPATMSVDELWALHEKIGDLLAEKIASELEYLKERLALLKPQADWEAAHKNFQTSGRRRYPTVLPQYRNPNCPSETWSGRGKQPLWVKLQLGKGKCLEDFRINHSKKS
jgi:DNA-binding protein H-NS